MHMQAHMSGQISGQVPNQAGPQLPGLSQQNGNSLPSQMQGLGGNWHSDPTRKYMQEKTFQLCQRTQPSTEWQPRLHDVVRRLDEMLYKLAPSEEEYKNIETLEHRVHALLKRPSSTSHRQPVSHLMASGHLSANGTGGGVHGSSFNASDGGVHEH